MVSQSFRLNVPSDEENFEPRSGTARSGYCIRCRNRVVWGVVALFVIHTGLSYFNELVGGSKNGHKHLLHSSIDWGQDLIYVKQWLAEHPGARPFYLAYHGAFEPQDIGIEYELPPQKPNDLDARTWLRQLPSGWYAISVNYLCGDQRAAPNGDGGKKSVHDDAYTAFQSLEPAAILGGSIWLFHVKGSRFSDQRPQTR